MSRLPALAAAAAAVLLCAPASAQQEPSLVTDLLRDAAQVEEKLVGLAEAIPESAYAWRPGEGVRSVAELFKHVISDNYLIGGIPGPLPPATTGIDPTDYRTAGAFEARALTKAQIVAEPATRQQLWILAVTHLHEHLGQGIAYARSNGVVPPWSR